MISQEIKDKYNLKKKGNHSGIGLSFVNKCDFLLLPGLIRGVPTYLMDCDFNGNPLPEGDLQMLMIKRIGSRKYTITNMIRTDFLLDINMQQLRDIAQRVLDRMVILPDDRPTT